MEAAKPEAQQYAVALVELAKATQTLARIEQELTAVCDLVDRNEEVRRFLADPKIRKQGKIEALRKIVKPQPEPTLLHFLNILVDKDRISLLNDVASHFFRQISLDRGRITGELVSPTPLPEEKVALIRKETSRVLGKDVDLRVRVDPGLLGGFFIQVGDFVLDDTIDRQLEDLRRQLLV